MYYPRLIDSYLQEWASRETHKPLLLRGARQVGKSTAVRHLADRFESYVEINFEKQASYIPLFQAKDIDVKRIVSQIAAMAGKRIVPGKTLLFLDEVQACPESIMSLWFFKEDLPELHVVAAGSLLEFALEDLPSFGVGRIHSMFMFPMTFDEFLIANGEQLLMEARNGATSSQPLPQPLYEKLVGLTRTFMLVGGMPEAVAKWVETHDYLACQEIQDDIVVTYEDDFPKYRKKIDPMLLRNTMRSVAVQVTDKFVFSAVEGNYKSAEVKKALDMLTKAGIVIPVTHTDGNGLPLGSEADKSYQKILLLDTGLMLRLLNMTTGDISELTEQILTTRSVSLLSAGNEEVYRYNGAASASPFSTTDLGVFYIPAHQTGYEQTAAVTVGYNIVTTGPGGSTIQVTVSGSLVLSDFDAYAPGKKLGLNLFLYVNRLVIGALGVTVAPWVAD